MPNLNDVCQKMSDENECIAAAAVIEQDSSLLLGLGFKYEDFSLDYFETIAAAAVNIYQGRNIKTVEKMIADMRGVIPVSCIEEVQLVMKNNSVFISSIRNNPQVLVFVMTTDKVDVDHVWNALRNNLGIIEESVS